MSGPYSLGLSVKKCAGPIWSSMASLISGIPRKSSFFTSKITAV